MLLFKGFLLKRSIRTKLIASFVFTISIMTILIVIMMFAVSSIVDSVADSYHSNVAADEYSSVLYSMENSLENYMVLRSFESIDNYFTFRSKLDSLTHALYQYPSSDEIRFSEYKITQLVLSFFNYADSALAFRRANNTSLSKTQYEMAELVYGYLSDEVNTLNALYFKRNISDYTEKMSLFSSARRMCIWLLLSIALLSFLWLIEQVHTITKPLTEISKVANSIADRHFDIPLLDETSHDEVGAICRAFNRMIVSIREYIQTIIAKAEEEKKLRDREIYMTTLYKDAQLKALQSQINPHFLFNTLNTGMQLAMMEGADKTSYFIEQTADFFRYNIQHQNREATLADEISLVDNYVYVMKVRFGSKFDFNKIIETDNLSVSIPGMTLQPLVENCIRHGLDQFERQGLITLHIYDSDDFLCIDVSDNGAGFPEQMREEILTMQNDSMMFEKKVPDTSEMPEIKSVDIAGSSETGKTSSGNGIGLRNVIYRLKIFYKNKNVFDILPNTDSKTGGHGTIFAIRIPYV